MASAPAAAALKARELFVSGKYDESLVELSRVVSEAEVSPPVAAVANGDAADDNLETRLDDLRRAAQYNSHVVRYYQSGFRDPKGLIGAVRSYLPESLMVDGQSDAGDLTDEQMSFVFAATGGVPLYNSAVLAFYEQQLALARRLLEFVFSRIDAVDDWLALRICFLLLDVYFRLDDLADDQTPPESHGPAEPQGWTTQKLLGRAKLVLTKLDALVLGTSRQTTPADDATLKGPEDEKPDDARRRNPGIVAPILGTPDPSSGAMPSLVDVRQIAEDRKFALLMYRARMEARRNNFKGFRKEVKTAVVAAEETTGKPIPAALFLKARMEKHPRKALKLLAGVVPACLESQPVVLNNVGVCSHRLGHHGLAAVAFASALRISNRLCSTTLGSTLVKSGNRRNEIAYNLGVELLLLGEYEEALRAFGLACQQMNTTSPTLWLRMAEAASGESARLERLHGNFSLCSVGSGPNRKLVLKSQFDDGFDKNKHREGLEFALACATASMDLLERKGREPRAAPVTPASFLADEQNGSADASTGNSDPGAGAEATEPPTETPASVPANDEATAYYPANSTAALKQAIWSMLAYTNLALGSPDKTLEATAALLSGPELSTEQMFAARMYAAEALCELGRADEALQHLTPSALIEHVSGPAELSGQQKLNFYVNVGIAHAARNDAQSAKKALFAGLELSNGATSNPSLLLLAALLALRAGAVGQAASMLRTRNLVFVQR